MVSIEPTVSVRNGTSKRWKFKYKLLRRLLHLLRVLRERKAISQVEILLTVLLGKGLRNGPLAQDAFIDSHCA